MYVMSRFGIVHVMCYYNMWSVGSMPYTEDEWVYGHIYHIMEDPTMNLIAQDGLCVVYSISVRVGFIL